MRRAALLALAVLVTAANAAGDGAGRAATNASPPTPARARELLHLLHQDCGSCHGMRLTGGLGPALTPEALRTKPAETLVATITSGRPGTAMPPWRRFLSEAEAEWLVARMVSGDVNVK
ncbi:MAG TPA: cytochrome c [Casimicrobiaceae bacterium]|nr:cytochrome c [Casimicrobiaceae bacterium]